MMKPNAIIVELARRATPKSRILIVPSWRHHHLEGHHPVHHLVAGAIHHSHGALADALEDPVATYPLGLSPEPGPWCHGSPVSRTSTTVTLSCPPPSRAAWINCRPIASSGPPALRIRSIPSSLIIP